MDATRSFGPKGACMHVVSDTRGAHRMKVDRALFVSSPSATDAERSSALGDNTVVFFSVQTTAFVFLSSALDVRELNNILVQYFGHK